jgi:hypothetical protein
MNEETVAEGLPFEDLLMATLHGSTGGRLRFLRVSATSRMVCVWGAAPTYYVRQLAEQAALSLVPAERLQLEIEVQPILRLHETEFGNQSSWRVAR